MFVFGRERERERDVVVMCLTIERMSGVIVMDIILNRSH